MCVQISISSSAFREPKLGTPFSLSVPGACVLSSQKQTRKQALKAQCAGGDTPVLTKVLRAGAQRQRINMPQGIREGFSGRGGWAGKGVLGRGNSMPLDFQSTFKYPITANRTRQVEWEELALEARRTTTRVKGGQPSSYSKHLLQEWVNICKQVSKIIEAISPVDSILSTCHFPWGASSLPRPEIPL